MRLIMRRVVVLPHPEEPTKNGGFTGGDAQSQVLTNSVSAVAFGDLGEFDSRSACCLRGVRRYGFLGEWMLAFVLFRMRRFYRRV